MKDKTVPATQTNRWTVWDASSALNSLHSEQKGVAEHASRLSSVVLIKPGVMFLVLLVSRCCYVEAVKFLGVPGTTVIFVNVFRHNLNFLIVYSYMVAVYFLCG